MSTEMQMPGVAGNGAARLLAGFAVLAMAAVPAVATPEIQTWQTGNGVRVLFVEAHELPIMDVQLVFAGGSSADPNGREGISVLATSLLDEGAAGLHANAIGYEFERLGAVYGGDVSSDSSTVYLRSLAAPDKLVPALENLRRVVLQPDFPPDAVERQRNRLLIGIQQKKQSPAALADDAFKAAIYGDHPYAHPDEGTETSLSAITRADLLAWQRQRHVSGNALLALVGDMDRASAEQLAERLVAGLPAGPALAPAPPVSPLPGPVQSIVEFPSSQTHIVMGQPGMKYGDPDYFPLLVGNHVLGGGGFVTRLFSVIREKHGLSYSASSYFSPRREAGPFAANLQTEAGQTDRALALLRETLAAFVKDGPTEAELRAAQQNLTGGFPLRIDSNRKILGYVGVIGFYNLPLDYLDRFIERVNAVTTAQVHDAFSRRLDAARMATILVGPGGPQPPQGAAP
jgi:zinc protease